MMDSRMLFCVLFILSVFSYSKAQWPLANYNQPDTLNFDQTKSGVLNAAFAGGGFSLSPSAGQLHSEAWAVEGMSDGNLDFGDESSSGDFARGSSSGGVITGGLYAFDVSNGSGPANYALGVQPTGSDFTSGSMTLLVYNAGNSVAASVDVHYTVLIYNDQNRANSLNFSWATSAQGPYNGEAALDFTSPGPSDASPAWVNHARNINLSVTLNPDDSLYLRWTGDDVSGGGSRDEFALDDIVVQLNAAGNVAPLINDIHTSPGSPTSSDNVHLLARVTDTDGVDTVYAQWGLNSGTLGNDLGMIPWQGDTFRTSTPVPAQADSTTVYYEITATDNHSNPATAVSPEQTYQVLDPIPEAQSGEILITEIMADPDAVNDSDGEYFELYNRTGKTFVLKDYVISDAGTNSHTINQPVVFPPYSFLVLAINADSAANGSFVADYAYSSFQLTNSADEIYLRNPSGVLVAEVEYDVSLGWPLTSGQSMVFTGIDGDDPNDVAHWVAANAREPGFVGSNGDLGSPGARGHQQRVDFLAFADGSWTQVPNNNTTQRDARVLSGQDAVLTINARVNSMVIEPDATLFLGSATLTVNDTLQLQADGSGYSQVMGKVEGWVEHQSYLQSGNQARWFNLAVPVKAPLDSLVPGDDGSVITLADTPGGKDTNMVNVWYYDAGLLNQNTGEGTWRPVANSTARLEHSAFSVYLGSPWFGTLPLRIKTTGRLINGNQQIPLDNSLSPNQYNFVPNPFPSALDWHEVVADNPGINATYYIYDEGLDSVYRGYNAAAGGSSINGATRYIAPGQAFYVNANAATTLQLEQDARLLSAQPAQYYLQPNPGVFLEVKSGSGRGDFCYAGFHRDASDQPHPRLDGMKRINYSPQTPNLWVDIQQEAYMFKFFDPEFQGRLSVPVHFDASSPGSYRLTPELVAIDPTWKVELEDRENDIRHDLRKGDFSFVHKGLNNPDRFVLHFSKSTVGQDENALEVPSIFQRGGELIVELPGSEPGQVLRLSDMQGKLIAEYQLNGPQDVVRLPLNRLHAGIYILSAQAGIRLLWREKVPVQK